MNQTISCLKSVSFILILSLVFGSMGTKEVSAEDSYAEITDEKIDKIEFCLHYGELIKNVSYHVLTGYTLEEVIEKYKGTKPYRELFIRKFDMAEFMKETFDTASSKGKMSSNEEMDKVSKDIAAIYLGDCLVAILTDW